MSLHLLRLLAWCNQGHKYIQGEPRTFHFYYTKFIGMQITYSPVVQKIMIYRFVYFIYRSAFPGVSAPLDRDSKIYSPQCALATSFHRGSMEDMNISKFLES